MTQCILLDTVGVSLPPANTLLRPLADEDAFIREVATWYFPDVSQCLLLTDLDGAAEPLVDDLWELQREGKDALGSALAEFLCKLVEERAGFVIWCADDFKDLPTVQSREQLSRELLEQTLGQPADLFVAHLPGRQRS